MLDKIIPKVFVTGYASTISNPDVITLGCNLPLSVAHIVSMVSGALTTKLLLPIANASNKLG